MAQSIKSLVTNTLKTLGRGKIATNKTLLALLEHAHENTCYIQATRLVTDTQASAADPQAMVNLLLHFTDKVSFNTDLRQFKTRKGSSVDIEAARQFFADGGCYTSFSEKPNKITVWGFDELLKQVEKNAEVYKKKMENENVVFEDDPRFTQMERELKALVSKFQAMEA